MSFHFRDRRQDGVLVVSAPSFSPAGAVSSAAHWEPSGPVRTLDDMSAAERAALERLYGAPIVRARPVAARNQAAGASVPRRRRARSARIGGR